MRALKEIRKYQREHELLMRKLPFQRLCQEIVGEMENREAITDRYNRQNRTYRSLCHLYHHALYRHGNRHRRQ